MDAEHGKKRIHSSRRRPSSSALRPYKIQCSQVLFSSPLRGKLCVCVSLSFFMDRYGDAENEKVFVVQATRDTRVC